MRYASAARLTYILGSTTTTIYPLRISHLILPQWSSQACTCPVSLCLVAEPQSDAVSQSVSTDVVPRPSRTSLKRSTSALRGTMQVLPPLSSSSDTRGEGEGGGRWLHDPISETPCAREAASRLFLPPGWCAQGKAAGRPAESGTTEVPGRERGRRVNGNRGAQGRQGKGGEV